MDFIRDSEETNKTEGFREKFGGRLKAVNTKILLCAART